MKIKELSLFAVCMNKLKSFSQNTLRTTKVLIMQMLFIFQLLCWSTRRVRKRESLYSKCQPREWNKQSVCCLGENENSTNKMALERERRGPCWCRVNKKLHEIRKQALSTQFCSSSNSHSNVQQFVCWEDWFSEQRLPVALSSNFPQKHFHETHFHGIAEEQKLLCSMPEFTPVSLRSFTG